MESQGGKQLFSLSHPAPSRENHPQTMSPTLLAPPGISGKAAAPEGALCPPFPGDQSPEPQGWTWLGEPLNPSSNQCRTRRPGHLGTGGGLKIPPGNSQESQLDLWERKCAAGTGAGAEILPQGQDTKLQHFRTGDTKVVFFPSG